jgi:uncharacterized SAM-binding protein YcdF (DUF218 family)
VFFFLSRILDVLLAPLSWSLACFVLGLVLFGIRPHKRRSILGLWLLGLLNLWAFSLNNVANALGRSLEDETSTVKPGATYDAIILLGGVVSVYADQPEGRRSYNGSAERLLAVFDALRTDQAKVAVITGGTPDKTRPEAKEAPTQRDQLVDWGIAPERLIVESNARNTYENAVETKKLAQANGWKSVLVVTSAFHMGRARGCFRAVELEVDTLVVDRRSHPSGARGYSLLPRATALDESTDALRELFGRVIYRARGYSK